MAKSLNFKRIVIEALLVFLLIQLGKEWISTLPYFTDTESRYIGLFFWPFAILLVIHRVIPWSWIRFSTALLFVIVWYQQTLWKGSFFTSEWIIGTYEQFKQSGFALFRMDWISMEPNIRTGLFYVLIWIGVYLLHHRVLINRKVWGLLILSIFYFSFLDTFFLYDGKWPIIKGIVYGFAMLAIINLNKVEGLINRRITHLSLGPWFMTAMIVLVAIGSIGYFAPKGEAKWPDPVSFFQAMKSGEGGPGGGFGLAKSGYGKDDRLLGGSFEFTEDVIFMSKVVRERYPAHYWRGESKEFYTGHGWETNQTYEQPFLFNKQNPFSLIDTPDHTKIDELVTFEQPTPLFFASGQMEHLDPIVFVNENRLSDSDLVTATINPGTYRIEATNAFVQYKVSSVIPKISEQAMVDESKKYQNSTSNYPDEILSLYTQLPETLPERVKELTDRVIGSETNLYRKVKRVESYLRWSGYQYRTTEIPYPAENQDFVDQFLFDTRRGYCDHFSTSMVVMLRTQGIPARWVKGYTFGDLESQTADTHVVTVRGKNAHSWVEVYFPDSGWIPFEPTASFNYPYEVLRSPDPIEEIPAAAVSRQINDLIEKEREKDQQKANEAKKASAKKAFNKWVPWIIVGLVMVLGGVLAVFFRDKILFRLQTLAMSNENGSNLVYKGYRLIMKWLEKIFHVRHEDQTIREYTAGLRLNDTRSEIIELTRVFEETRYGEKEPSISKGQFLEIWKSLLKKLRS